MAKNTDDSAAPATDKDTNAQSGGRGHAAGTPARDADANTDADTDASTLRDGSGERQHAGRNSDRASAPTRRTDV